MNILLNLFKGKLTFALALLAVAYAVVGVAFGWIGNETAVEIAWIGLAAFGLRRAVK